MSARREPQPRRPAAASAASTGRGLEAWVRAVFVVGSLGALVFLLLGFESPAPWHRRLYRIGPLVVALGGAALLGYGLFVCVRRRPFLRRGRLAALLLAGGCLLIGSCPLPYPSPYADRRSPVAFRLPLEGEWSVLYGGEAPYWNRLRLQPDRRFGYEFWRVGKDGQPDEAASLGAPVLAPAPGEVVAIHPQREDVALAQDRPATPRAVVVLGLEDGTHAFLRGLERTSLAVRPGQRVEAGDPLGRVGAPPHPGLPVTLGLHLQDTAVPGEGVGIPLAFARLLVEGELREAVRPAGGEKLGVGLVGWRVAAPPDGAGAAAGPGGD